MDVAGPREHQVFAALYDRKTGPLEQGVLGERRAGLLADLRGQVLDVGAGPGRTCRISAPPAAWWPPNQTPRCAGGWPPS